MRPERLGEVVGVAKIDYGVVGRRVRLLKRSAASFGCARRGGSPTVRPEMFVTRRHGVWTIHEH
jgi:hypothetical protein